jgi:uridine kinase
MAASYPVAGSRGKVTADSAQDQGGTFVDTVRLLDDLATLIQRIARPHPVRVAVDGRSAAGKTTLADALANVLVRSQRQVLRAGIDDFHPPGHARRPDYTPQSLYDEGYDYRSFQRLLLDPLGPGGSRSVRLALHDSLSDRPAATETLSADDDAIAIIDGAFLLRPELRSHWDLALWLDIPFATMLERAVARDVAWVGDAETVRKRYLARWLPAHELYEVTGAREAANVIVDNEDPARPRLVRMIEPR